ncbi:MAG: tyramine oxidase, partial [Actinomycetota bacterium]|nr:tyramine oxidase [Actinomycetota bacterium]
MSAHPLDPLTAEEIRQAVAELRRDRGVDEAWRFASIELKEPTKEVVRALDPGSPNAQPREARVVCWSRVEQVTYKALVSLTDDTVLSWDDVPGEQPN